MELDRWIAALHARVQPVNGSPERSVLYLRPRLEDLSPYWFTEEAIAGIWMKLRSLNSADRVRKVLREYHAAQTAVARPPPISQQERELREWDIRKAELRHDWDDPQGILRKVHDCRGNVLMLRLLAKLVRMWAPQHLGFLPPHILAAIENDSEIAPADAHLRFADDTPPEGTRSVAEQLAALNPDTRPPPQPRHLTPEQLDIVNPLPGGRKRTDDATLSAAPVYADASSSTADEDETAPG
jgi:hypothetical protein